MKKTWFLHRLAALPAVLAIGLALCNAAWAGGKYRVLYSFKGGTDGGGVFAGVAFDTKGNLYGTTTGGGAHGDGTAFELMPRSSAKWNKKILYSFCALPRCADGALPQSTPVFDTAGNLYGTSNVTAFELSPDSGGWRFKVISDNAGGSSLIIDDAGNLYGAGGSVWELVRASGWKVKLFHIFCRTDCRDGDDALAPPVFDAAGNLYGTTKWGGNFPPKCPGSAGCGVAYEVESLGGGKWKYHVLHRFAAFTNDGQLPFAGVTVDNKGNIYGTTLYSGTSSGTAFELSPQPDGSWKETILYNFPNAGKNGGAPVGVVTFDNLGNLYGTGSAGGDPDCSCGVVFKMTPQGNGKWGYSVLHRFKGNDGYGPGYNLIFDKNYKHLYGTTAAGGSGGYGVVYEITP